MFTDICNQAPPSWRFTHHLCIRAAERGITTAEINVVLADPEITYAQPGYGPNRRVMQRGELGVVVDVATSAVITVVFRDPARWIAPSSQGLAA